LVEQGKEYVLNQKKYLQKTNKITDLLSFAKE
jgi:hypothetical protein